MSFNKKAIVTARSFFSHSLSLRSKLLIRFTSLPYIFPLLINKKATYDSNKKLSTSSWIVSNGMEVNCLSILFNHLI